MSTRTDWLLHMHSSHVVVVARSPLRTATEEAKRKSDLDVKDLSQRILHQVRPENHYTAAAAQARASVAHLQIDGHSRLGKNSTAAVLHVQGHGLRASLAAKHASGER